MVTSIFTSYLGKASAATDSEVKAWMKGNNIQLILTKVGLSTTSTQNRANLTKKRLYMSLVQRNEPEQDTMTNRFGQQILSTHGSENETSVLVEPMAPVAPDSDVSSIFLTEDLPSPGLRNREGTHHGDL
jgi:hypothetical protein